MHLLQVVEIAETQDKAGGRSASATISGEGVYGRLKFESGIHRVQRVPATETSGRVHTSAASVAILPQADEVDCPCCQPITNQLLILYQCITKLSLTFYSSHVTCLLSLP